MKKIFRSKIDPWLAIGTVAFTVLSVAVFALLAAPMNLGIWPALSFAALITVWTLITAAPVRYILDEQYLTIRSGLFARRIPLASLEITPKTRTFWTAAAWSFDRIQLRYGQKCVQISPENPEVFLKEIQSR